MLAVVFGCMRFNHYLYDGEFTYQSDHKPLEDIHLKHIMLLQGYKGYFRKFNLSILLSSIFIVSKYQWLMPLAEAVHNRRVNSKV